MTANNLNYMGNDKNINDSVCSECKRAERLPINTQSNLAHTYHDHYHNNNNNSNNNKMNNKFNSYGEYYNTPLAH